MTFLVKSAIKHRLYRHVIRKTWGSVKSIKGLRVKVIFILAKSQSKSEMDLLRLESKYFEDILVCDLMDSYHNMTLKVSCCVFNNLNVPFNTNRRWAKESQIMLVSVSKACKSFSFYRNIFVIRILQNSTILKIKYP